MIENWSDIKARFQWVKRVQDVYVMLNTMVAQKQKEAFNMLNRPGVVHIALLEEILSHLPNRV